MLENEKIPDLTGRDIGGLMANILGEAAAINPHHDPGVGQ
jgi:hypothetical protein